MAVRQTSCEVQFVTFPGSEENTSAIDIDRKHKTAATLI